MVQPCILAAHDIYILSFTPDNTCFLCASPVFLNLHLDGLQEYLNYAWWSRHHSVLAPGAGRLSAGIIFSTTSQEGIRIG
jgi:hypothetical protein